jgi:hypothetical protein
MLMWKVTFLHRRGAENAEVAQRHVNETLRPLRLCGEGMNVPDKTLLKKARSGPELPAGG